jgi:hypothetical protein
MAERLRTLLERPLEPSVARAMLVLALAVSTGFAAIALLGRVGDRPAVQAGADRDSSIPRIHPGRLRPAFPATVAELARQDGQDRPGTVAHRRALEEVARHRALQHVPYRVGGVTIRLLGAKGHKAVLDVGGRNLAAAHRGWDGFLRRYQDDGRSYLPRFHATKVGRP